MVLETRVDILETDVVRLRNKAAAFDEVVLQLNRFINIVVDLTELIETPGSRAAMVSGLVDIRGRLDEVAEVLDIMADPSRLPMP